MQRLNTVEQLQALEPGTVVYDPAGREITVDLWSSHGLEESEDRVLVSKSGPVEFLAAVEYVTLTSPGTAAGLLEHTEGGTVFGVVMLDAMDFNREQRSMPPHMRERYWHRTEVVEFSTAQSRDMFLQKRAPEERLLLVERVQYPWTVTAGPSEVVR